MESGAVASWPVRARGRLSEFPVFLALAVGLRAAPLSTIGLLLLAILNGIVPVSLYVSVSFFAGEVARDPAHVALELWVPLIAGIFFLLQASGPLLHQLGSALGRRIDGWVQHSVMVAAVEPPTIAHMETPAFRNAAELARSWEASAYPPSEAVYSLVWVVSAAVVATGSIVLLLPFSWWAPLVLATGYILMTIWGTRVREEGPATASRTAGDMRRSQYLRDQAFEPASGREGRLFNLAGWFRQGSDRDWKSAMADIWGGRYGTRGTALLTIVALIASHLLIFALIMQAALDGSVTVTQAALYLQGAGGLVNFWLPWHVIALREGTRPLPALRQLAGAPSVQAPAGRELAPGAPSRGITFEGVSFTYPGRSTPVFEGLDLTIRAGAALAIVGANGAGKTTLVKLLCGLLEPDRGTVDVDGTELRSVRSAWQARVAVIFQDFVRYPFTARDNVMVGRPADDPAALGRALARAMAEDAVRDLPSGLDTPLSREFGGVDLSGGQWQRLALARAMYAVERGATVLVLDEPTAQLDVRAEAALFDRFLELTESLTTVLISHRFSSVRHADRIVVLEQGRVVEDGTHDELVKAGGRYAAMFRQQARHFEPSDA